MASNIRRDIIKNLRTLLERDKRYPAELARDLELTASTVSKWLSGQMAPDLGNIDKMIDRYGWTTEEIFLGKRTESKITTRDALKMIERALTGKANNTKPEAAIDAPLILLVDDEEFTRDLTAERLSEEGYKCLTASDGKEAIDLLTKHHIQIVISDNRMPQVSGIRLLQIVKKKYPNVCRIFATSSELIDKVLAEIAPHHYITKPYTKEQLLEAIHVGWRNFQNEGLDKAD